MAARRNKRLCSLRNWSASLSTALLRNHSMRQHRPRIARAPTARFRECDEALDHFVEQRGLLQIEHMAGLWEESQAGRGQVLLQKQARLDAGVVFIAADD